MPPNYSEEDLGHATKYFFSPVAKSIVRKSGLTLESTPDEVIAAAKQMAAAAFSGNAYSIGLHISKEQMQTEVLAFPAAKIIVSLSGRFELFRRFSAMFANRVRLGAEGETDMALADLAFELGLGFSAPDSKEFFAEIPIKDYLGSSFGDKKQKLVNQQVSGGKVFLTRPEFCSLLGFVAGKQLRDSLPMKVGGVPKKFLDAGQEIEKEFSAFSGKGFSAAGGGFARAIVASEALPESFPPCMSKISEELASGVNVGHSARFAFAAFMHSIGVPQEKIVDAFRGTPNFSERTTRYQVERLVKRGDSGYSCPGCEKMRSYGLCVADCPGISNPAQFYRREAFAAKPKKSEAEKIQ